MWAMLRKDWYVVGKYTVSVLLFELAIAAAFRWIGEPVSSVYYTAAIVAADTVILNAIESDVRCGWDHFIAMTALCPWKPVLGKYLLSYGAVIWAVGIGALLVWNSPKGMDRVELWTAVVLNVLCIAMMLPLTYRYGRQKGGIILLAIWGLAAVLILGTAQWSFEAIEWIFGWMEEVPAPALGMGLTVLLAAANVWSFRLSIRFYTRRQRGAYDGDLG